MLLEARGSNNYETQCTAPSSHGGQMTYTVHSAFVSLQTSNTRRNAWKRGFSLSHSWMASFVFSK